MTVEELEKVPFHFVAHMSMEDEHTSTYVIEHNRLGICEHTSTNAIEDNRLGICEHTIYKDGRPYRHWRIGTNIYKSKKKFLEAIKDYNP